MKCIMTMKGNKRKKKTAPAFTFIDGLSRQEMRFDSRLGADLCKCIKAEALLLTKGWSH